MKVLQVAHSGLEWINEKQSAQITGLMVLDKYAVNIWIWHFMQIHSFVSSFMLDQLPRMFRLRIACEREISSSYFYTKINENIKKVRGGSLDDPVRKQSLIANLHEKLAN